LSQNRNEKKNGIINNEYVPGLLKQGGIQYRTALMEVYDER
jgi:hypothetical protein